jgi:hypothetical protein
MSLLKLNVTWSLSLVHRSAVLWRARKPNWFVSSRSLSVMCPWPIFRATFSNRLPVEQKKKICMELRRLSDFDKIVTLLLQDVRKWQMWRQWLHKCVRYNTGLLEGVWGTHSNATIFSRSLSFNGFINSCQTGPFFHRDRCLQVRAESEI